MRIKVRQFQLFLILIVFSIALSGCVNSVKLLPVSNQLSLIEAGLVNLTTFDKDGLYKLSSKNQQKLNFSIMWPRNGAWETLYTFNATVDNNCLIGFSVIEAEDNGLELQFVAICDGVETTELRTSLNMKKQNTLSLGYLEKNGVQLSNHDVCILAVDVPSASDELISAYPLADYPSRSPVNEHQRIVVVNRTDER